MARFHRRHLARWNRVRREALERDGWRCRKCGKAGKLEVDHVVPVARGGAPFDLNNLQTLCRGDHIAKTRGENLPAVRGRAGWDALVNSLLRP